jgi:hypothetical protein
MAAVRKGVRGYPRSIRPPLLTVPLLVHLILFQQSQWNADMEAALVLI